MLPLGLLALGGGLANYFGGDKGGQTYKQQQVMPSWQKGLGSSLGGYFAQQFPRYQPAQEYSGLGQMKTPTGYEQTGLDKLGAFLQQPAESDVFKAGRGYVTDVLGGEYDPLKSPYWESYKKALDYQKGQDIESMKSELLNQGMMYSSVMPKTLQDYTTKMGLGREQTLANLFQEDIARRERASGAALPYASAEQALPLQQIQASQAYGSLPRQLEGVGYKDFLRKQQELKGILSGAMGMYGSQPQMGIPSYTAPQTSGLSRFVQGFTPIALQAYGMGGK